MKGYTTAGVFLCELFFVVTMSLVPEVSVPQDWGNRRGRKDY